jgi:murein L,D-transpeptidase YafK
MAGFYGSRKARSRIAVKARRLLVLAVVLVVALAASAGAAPGKADRVLVLKSERELMLLRGGVVLKSYPIALGRHPKGPKRRLGDERTPEGIYLIDGRTANTPYHRALHISYPDYRDVAQARARHWSPGGAIFIHGMPQSYGPFDPVRFFVDWTNGCIAVGNIAIEEIWNSVDDGTVIEIRP